MRPQEIKGSLDAIRQNLDEYMAFGAYQQEVKVGSAKLTTKTIITGIILAACVVSVVLGFGMEDKDAGAGLAGFGIIIGIFVGVSFLICLANDLRSSGLAVITDPRLFVKHFMAAVLRNRTGRGYIAVASASRAPGVTHDIDLGKIPQHKEAPSIDGKDSFAKYWQKYVRQGPPLNSRSVSVRKVHEAREISPGVYAVEVDLRFYSYPSLALLGFLVIGIFIAILVMLIQQRHDMTVTKIVIEHRGRLFMRHY
jgi:hypothetical protein